jgi:hypothetical protein
VAMLVGVVALNALSVSRWVRGSTGSTLGHAIWRFSRVKVSHRARLVRVGARLSVPCLYTRVDLIGISVWVGGALAWYLLGGFQGTDPLGGFTPLNRWFWVLLVLGTQQY